MVSVKLIRGVFIVGLLASAACNGGNKDPYKNTPGNDTLAPAMDTTRPDRMQEPVDALPDTGDVMEDKVYGGH